MRYEIRRVLKLIDERMLRVGTVRKSSWKGKVKYCKGSGQLDFWGLAVLIRMMGFGSVQERGVLMGYHRRMHSTMNWTCLLFQRFG